MGPGVDEAGTALYCRPMHKSLTDIADRAAGSWLDTREGDIRAARASGSRAASRDLSLALRRHHDFEAGLLARAKQSVLDLRGQAAAYAADLRRQIDDLARERDDHISRQLAEAREQRQAALAALESRFGPGSARFSAQARALEQAERDHRAIRAAVSGRPLRRQLVGVYWLVLLLLAIAEVPINRLAFELFFQEQPLFSLVLAAAVGAALMFLAHLTGLLLRRAPPPPLWRQLRHWAALALILLVALALMYGLASMRQLYVQLLQNEGASLQQQVEGLLQGNAVNTVTQVASTQLGLAGYTLLTLNVTVFLVGAAASSLRHDPHPDYENAYKAEQRSRGRLVRTRARFESRIAEARKEHDARVRALDELLRETEAKHDQLAAQLAGVEPFVADTIARIANGVRSRSLAHVQGVLAGLPEGAGGAAIQEIRAASEADILRGLLAEADDPA